MSTPYPPDQPYGQQPPPPPGYGQAPPPGYGEVPSPGYGGQPPGYGQAPPPGYGQAPPAGYGQAPPPGYGYGAQPPAYGAPYGAGVQKPTGWFIVNWLFFWPLAIYSLVSAWGNIDRALFAGDIAGAQYQAGRVRKFGIIALCIGIGIFVLYLVLIVAIIGTAADSSCSGYGC